MDKKLIITINREFGAGGRQIADLLGQQLGLKVYDRHFLETVKEKHHLSSEEMERIKAEKPSWWNSPSVTSEQLYEEEKQILLSIAEQDSCIILGRTGFHIFRDNPDAVKIFLIADKNYRRDRVARRLNTTDGNADLVIERVDRARENFAFTFSGKSRYDVHNYDLIINVTNRQPEQVVKAIIDYIK